MWWMLTREVLRMRGTISREHPWEVMPDLYFYRDPEEVTSIHHAVHRSYTLAIHVCLTRALVNKGSFDSHSPSKKHLLCLVSGWVSCRRREK